MSAAFQGAAHTPVVQLATCNSVLPAAANLTCIARSPAQVITTSGRRNGCVWSRVDLVETR